MASHPHFGRGLLAGVHPPSICLISHAGKDPSGVTVLALTGLSAEVFWNGLALPAVSQDLQSCFAAVLCQLRCVTFRIDASKTNSLLGLQSLIHSAPAAKLTLHSSFASPQQSNMSHPEYYTNNFQPLQLYPLQDIVSWR